LCESRNVDEPTQERIFAGEEKFSYEKWFEEKMKKKEDSKSDEDEDEEDDNFYACESFIGN
jgi:hypothetical protein